MTNSAENSAEKAAEKTVLDIEQKNARYYLVNLAFRWAKELRRKRRKEAPLLSELVDEAMKDILEGRITPEFIKGLPEEPEAVIEEELAPIEVEGESKEDDDDRRPARKPSKGAAKKAAKKKKKK